MNEVKFVAKENLAKFRSIHHETQTECPRRKLEISAVEGEHFRSTSFGHEAACILRHFQERKKC